MTITQSQSNALLAVLNGNKADGRTLNSLIKRNLVDKEKTKLTIYGYHALGLRKYPLGIKDIPQDIERFRGKSVSVRHTEYLCSCTHESSINRSESFTLDAWKIVDWYVRVLKSADEIMRNSWSLSADADHDHDIKFFNEYKTRGSTYAERSRIQRDALEQARLCTPYDPQSDDSSYKYTGSGVQLIAKCLLEGAQTIQVSTSVKSSLADTDWEAKELGHGYSDDLQVIAEVDWDCGS